MFLIFKVYSVNLSRGAEGKNEGRGVNRKREREGKTPLGERGIERSGCPLSPMGLSPRIGVKTSKDKKTTNNSRLCRTANINQPTNTKKAG